MSSLAVTSHFLSLHCSINLQATSMSSRKLIQPLNRSAQRPTLQRRTIVRKVAMDVVANYTKDFHFFSRTSFLSENGHPICIIFLPPYHATPVAYPCIQHRTTINADTETPLARISLVKSTKPALNNTYSQIRTSAP